MSVVTKKGDTGETGVIGGRVPKYNPQIHAIGAIDELNSCLGILAAAVTGQLRADIERIQRTCFRIGSTLASATDAIASKNMPHITEADVVFLETEINRIEPTLPELKNFILPGGDRAASLAFWVRTVCRRAERELTEYTATTALIGPVVPFINRLSDYLFILGRKLNHDAGIAEIWWHADNR